MATVAAEEADTAQQAAAMAKEEKRKHPRRQRNGVGRDVRKVRVTAAKVDSQVYV